MSAWTTEGSLLMSNQFEKETAWSIENIFAHFKYEADKVSGVLKTSPSECTTGAQRKIENCVAMLSSRLTSVRELGSVKHSAPALSPSAAAADTARSRSACPTSKKGQQQFGYFLLNLEYLAKDLHFLQLLTFFVCFSSFTMKYCSICSASFAVPSDGPYIYYLTTWFIWGLIPICRTILFTTNSWSRGMFVWLDSFDRGISCWGVSYSWCGVAFVVSGTRVTRSTDTVRDISCSTIVDVFFCTEKPLKGPAVRSCYLLKTYIDIVLALLSAVHCSEELLIAT